MFPRYSSLRPRFRNISWTGAYRKGSLSQALSQIDVGVDCSSPDRGLLLVPTSSTVASRRRGGACILHCALRLFNSRPAGELARLGVHLHLLALLDEEQLTNLQARFERGLGGQAAGRGLAADNGLGSGHGQVVGQRE